MTRVAVTAASGRLGSEIVQATIEVVGKDCVIGLARTPERAESLGIEVRPGDYNSASELEESLQGIDTLLIVSGMDAPEKRIAQHRNVIEAARKTGVGKIVYTSVQGAEENTAFSPIIQSNRQTEEDLRNSGLQWVIGRNGIYIEPDVEYIENYKQRGEIANCAGDGKCGYTTRPELAYAYARMLTESKHDGQTYNLHGVPITQQQLAVYLNEAFGTDLKYRAMSVAEYREERIAELVRLHTSTESIRDVAAVPSNSVHASHNSSNGARQCRNSKAGGTVRTVRRTSRAGGRQRLHGGRAQCVERLDDCRQ